MMAPAQPDAETLARRIAQGRGAEPADLVLRGGRVFDVATGEMIDGDVAITGDTITGTGAAYRGRREIDVTGLVLVPGFIDTHLHIESSLITPLEFDRCVAPRGVTTAICDPHEIANVLGLAGLRYFLDAARLMAMDLRLNLSSCVPSSAMETAGAVLTAADLAPLMDEPAVIGLAEMMNYPGVLSGDPDCLAKLALFAGRHIDGHCPLLAGRDLNAYAAAGVRTDHETTSEAEGREKLARGLHLLIREGSVSRDLAALMPLITERLSTRIAFCTDDRNPLDIAEAGHLDHIIRTAIAAGASPLAVYRAASLSGAAAFGLRDRGLVAPGWRADIVALDSLEACRAQVVVAGGRVLEGDGYAAPERLPPVGRGSVRLPDLAEDRFRVAATPETPVIGILPGKIITEHRRLALPQADGQTLPDLARDVVRIAVIERHGKRGSLAAGFVQGTGLKAGAIASTVCHDHHNLVVIGADVAGMQAAARRLAVIEGGFVVIRDGKVLAELPLPVAGLMSLEPFETVTERLRALRIAARSLGVTLDEPFLQIAFLCLPVIPHLKITDRGLVDVDRFSLIG